MKTKQASDIFRIEIYTHEGERFSSVCLIQTGDGADFYESGEEIGWQDGNSLFANCGTQTIRAARQAALAALA
jgi:hypothetical protein